MRLQVSNPRVEPQGTDLLEVAYGYLCSHKRTLTYTHLRFLIVAEPHAHFGY